MLRMSLMLLVIYFWASCTCQGFTPRPGSVWSTWRWPAQSPVLTNRPRPTTPAKPRVTHQRDEPGIPTRDAGLSSFRYRRSPWVSLAHRRGRTVKRAVDPMVERRGHRRPPGRAESVATAIAPGAKTGASHPHLIIMLIIRRSKWGGGGLPWSSTTPSDLLTEQIIDELFRAGVSLLVELIQTRHQRTENGFFDPPHEDRPDR